MTKSINIISNGKIINLLNNRRLFLISGPCVVEGEKITLQIAEKIKKITSNLDIPFIFKASYKKANRTKGDSFRSIGVQNSLDILKKVREEFHIPVLTDVHSELEASIAADYVDILQIPAFLSRQTELLEAAGETGRIVNIKKGQFLSPEDMLFQIKKVESTGNKKILITERGSSFGYHNLVVDMRSLPILKSFGYPVVFDATHSLQMPSKENGVSGGTPDLIYPIARAAAAAGVNGIFIETHPNPAKALSDANSMLPLNKLEPLLKQLKRVHELVTAF
ncbi:MAG: 3-deoxy-8-phosphooctulonate synthase [Ignavibacteria bacterium]|jgi:2-dehydro-3-deoxyphosphooctonate aldolase (KDO 8-P synthase)